MPAAVKLRTDYSVDELRRLAKGSKDANQSRRLLSLAAVLEGRARCPAARSRRLAYDDQAPHAEKHYADLPPTARAGTQPG
jgi:hypothetical protein